MKKILLVLLLTAGFLQQSFGQCGGVILTVNNPSFEGTPAAHVTPPGWDICMPGVTPDTQPGFWGQTLPPSNGGSYLGLVHQPSSGWQEGAGQNLSSPMVAGTTYNFTIDLAVPISASPSTGILTPPYCVALQLWGGTAGVNSGCHMGELLWQSPPITNTAWQTYTLTFTPTSNWNHILFVIHTIPPPCTNGQYLFVDNMTPIVPQSDVAQFNWTDVCFGDPIQFIDSSYSPDATIVTWQWDFGDGTSSTTQSPSHNYLNPGAYNVTLTITTNVPCDTFVSHIVNVWDLPAVSVSGGGNICATPGTTLPITFTFTGTGPWDLVYSDGTTTYTVNGITTSPYIIDVTTSGTYAAVSVTNANCPGSVSGTAVVNFDNLPSLSITPPSASICAGESVLLLASGADTYTWSPPNGLSGTSGASVIASPDESTTYTVLGANSAGCTGTTVATVIIYGSSVIHFDAEPSSGCVPLTVNFSYNPGTGVMQDSWVWDFDDINADTNFSTLEDPVHTFENPGIYNVILTITTVEGCIGQDTVTIYAFPNPLADFISHPELVDMTNPVYSFVDQSTIAYHWSWHFDDPLSGPDNYAVIPNPAHMFTGTGTYYITLIVESENGCRDTVTKPVTVYPELIVYVPNAFSPDGNTVNDMFRPSLMGIIPESYSMEIYDRWGKLLFRTSDLESGWDGRDGNDKVCPPNVYVWIIRFDDIHGKDYKRIGHVSVIR